METLKTIIGQMATRMTIEQMRNDEAREYNQSVWNESIDRLLKYSDVEFFKVDADECFSYSRFYVVYTLETGLRLLNDFSYSSAITSGGFYNAYVLEGNIVDGKFTWFEDGKVLLKTMKVRGTNEKGEEVETAIGTHKEAREYMTETSKKYGSVYTKCFFH
jgi:hypothetical protein